MDALDPRPREVAALDRMPTLTQLRQDYVANSEPLVYSIAATRPAFREVIFIARPPRAAVRGRGALVLSEGHA